MLRVADAVATGVRAVEVAEVVACSAVVPLVDGIIVGIFCSLVSEISSRFKEGLDQRRRYSDGSPLHGVLDQVVVEEQIIIGPLKLDPAHNISGGIVPGHDVAVAFSQGYACTGVVSDLVILNGILLAAEVEADPSPFVITSGCRGREDPSPSGEGMNRAPPLCRKL